MGPPLWVLPLEVARRLRKKMTDLLERPVLEVSSAAPPKESGPWRLLLPFSGLEARLRKALRSKFVTDSFYLEAGHIGGNAVRFVVLLFLVSLLGPAEFGLYSLAFAVYGILQLLVQPPVHSTAVVFFSEARSRGKIEEARGVLSFYLKSQVLLSLFLLGVGSLLITFLSSLLFGKTLPPHLVITLMLQNLAGIFYFYLLLFFLGLRAMRAHAILGLTDAFVRSPLVLGAVLIGLGVEGALWANVLAYLMASGYSLVVYSLYARRHYPPYASILAIWRQGGFWRDCRRYLGVNVTYHLSKGLSSLYDNLPVVLVSHFSGLEATGQFVVALRLANIPRALATPLITNTRSRLPEARVQGLQILRQTYRKIERFSLLTLGGVSILLVPAGYVFFLLFSGGSYLPAFPVYLVILLASATAAYSITQGPFLLTIGRMDIELKWTMAGMVSLLILSFWLGPSLGAMAVALGMVAFYAHLVPKRMEIHRIFSRWAREKGLREPARPRA